MHLGEFGFQIRTGQMNLVEETASLFLVANMMTWWTVNDPSTIKISEGAALYQLESDYEDEPMAV